MAADEFSQERTDERGEEADHDQQPDTERVEGSATEALEVGLLATTNSLISGEARTALRVPGRLPSTGQTTRVNVAVSLLVWFAIIAGLVLAFFAFRNNLFKLFKTVLAIEQTCKLIFLA